MLLNNLIVLQEFARVVPNELSHRLLTNVEFVITSLLRFLSLQLRMLAAAPPAPALFSVNVLLVMVPMPAFRIAPPLCEFDARKVRKKLLSIVSSPVLAL